MARTETFQLVSVQSGEDDGCLWVSLGFTSALQKYDVLHVVCGQEVDDQDRKLGMDGIYLERFDQAYSGYKGAREITVSESRVEVLLTKRGAKDLAFSGPVSFMCSKRLKGYAHAVRVFRRMSEQECGSVVRVV